MTNAIILGAVLVGLSWPTAAMTTDNSHGQHAHRMIARPENLWSRALQIGPRHDDGPAAGVTGEPSGAAPSAATPMEVRLTAVIRESGNQDLSAEGTVGPWGVQLAGGFSKEQALASYVRARQRFADIIGTAPTLIIGSLPRYRGTRAFYQVRVPTVSRETALALCDSIHRAGGDCAVLAN
jgi:SPOR domain